MAKTDTESDQRQGATPATTTRMDFRVLKQAVQRRFNDLKAHPLFHVQIDKDAIWDLYLSSFPEGSNPQFRERSEHDCSACRAFIKNAGGMVAIIDGKLATLWDIQAGEYQAIVDALADHVRGLAIDNVFLHREGSIGLDKNHEETKDGVLTWEHLHVSLPQTLYCAGTEMGPRHAEYRALHDVVLRSLVEISPDAIETVQDLISQNSLYRGAEKKALVDTFGVMKRQFDKITGDTERDIFAWAQVIGPNAFVCRMRNDVMGTLLVDLSEGVELEKAVKSFEDKVSGTNYKRPTALVTPRMRDEAKQKLQDLGLIDALERRYARLEDVKITNVLFADRNARKRMAGDVFDEIPTKGQDSKNFDKVEEVTIDKFLTDILPTATAMEVFVENKHTGNLVSLIAPFDLTAKSLFKWPNPFSWSYNGDVADSIKERVKAAGGNVTGDVCCRLAWFNHDDLDFHMKEPGYEIYYGNRGSASPNGGKLDVDMNAGSGTTRQPVENIFYGTLGRIRHGRYELYVHQYCNRDSTDPGFEVEIDVQGAVHRFTYPKAMRTGDKVVVAILNVTAQGVEVIPVLPSSQASREVWNLKTQDFHAVSALMLSPNFWDNTHGAGLGNKHFFFMLNGCRNDGSARGFYNEFLNSELEPHRKTMEIVGSRMRTEECEDQLSGLGLSSTQRNSLVVRVHGSFVRTLKIAF